MSNPNEPKSYSREVRQESYNDANGHTHVTRTSEVNNVANPNAYRDGYVQGRVSENHYQEEVLAERDNENAGRGLLIGILLTSLAALTAGAIWYYNQRNDADVPTTIVVPNSQPAPSPSPEAKRETTIIEKTRDVPVPVVVPQQQAPAPQAPAPDINISVPNSVTQPPAQEAPATQSAPTQSESQSNSTSEPSISTDTQSTQSSTDTTTPSADTSSSSDTTSGSTSTGGGSTGDSAQ